MCKRHLLKKPAFTAPVGVSNTIAGYQAITYFDVANNNINIAVFKNKDFKMYT